LIINKMNKFLKNSFPAKPEDLDFDKAKVTIRSRLT
jgi:hypothetical protein